MYHGWLSAIDVVPDGLAVFQVFFHLFLYLNLFAQLVMRLNSFVHFRLVHVIEFSFGECFYKQ